VVDGHRVEGPVGKRLAVRSENRDLILELDNRPLAIVVDDLIAREIDGLAGSDGDRGGLSAV
jgi:hypothetical protein